MDFAVALNDSILLFLPFLLFFYRCYFFFFFIYVVTTTATTADGVQHQPFNEKNVEGPVIEYVYLRFFFLNHRNQPNLSAVCQRLGSCEQSSPTETETLTTLRVCVLLHGTLYYLITTPSIKIEMYQRPVAGQQWRANKWFLSLANWKQIGLDRRCGRLDSQKETCGMEMFELLRLV